MQIYYSYRRRKRTEKKVGLLIENFSFRDARRRQLKYSIFSVLLKFDFLPLLSLTRRTNQKGFGRELEWAMNKKKASRLFKAFLCLQSFFKRKAISKKDETPSDAQFLSNLSFIWINRRSQTCSIQSFAEKCFWTIFQWTRKLSFQNLSQNVRCQSLENFNLRLP